MDLDY